MSNEAQLNGHRFQLQSKLRVLLGEFITVCHECELNNQDIAEDVADCLYDASDKKIDIWTLPSNEHS